MYDFYAKNAICKFWEWNDKDLALIVQFLLFVTNKCAIAFFLILW